MVVIGGGWEIEEERWKWRDFISCGLDVEDRLTLNWNMSDYYIRIGEK